VAAESATNPPAPLSTVSEPTTNAVATIAAVVEAIPDVAAELPTSETPVADVITSVQDMLTSAVNAVLPLVNVPSDLYTLLAGTQLTTATIGVGAGYRIGPAPLVPLVMPTWPQVPPGTDIVDARSEVAVLATAGGVAATGVSEQLSVSGAAPLAVDGTTPTGLLPALDHALRALLVPASKLALAAVALPGVGGLLIVCAAGIRIGYRQAKATLMVRASGIARFAGSGPVGVVRSGALIALRPRPARVTGPVASRATRFVDQAA
jgi:hypothetical protein